MGFWGTSLYANDCTCDVRDGYLRLLQMKYSNEDAYLEIRKDFSEYIGTDEEPLFWYALADTQWKTGRLTSEVKENALRYLECNGGAEFWEEGTKAYQGWLKTIAKLKERLNKPQPREKRIEAPADYQYNPGNRGDVFAYRFHSPSAKEMQYEGKYILFQKLDDRINGRDLQCPFVIFFDELYDHIPTHIVLEQMRILPFDPPERFMPSGKNSDFPMLNMGAVLDLYRKRNSPEKYITYIGSLNVVHPILNAVNSHAEFGWDDIEETLLYYHSQWQNYSYQSYETESVVSLKESTKE